MKHAVRLAVGESPNNNKSLSEITRNPLIRSVGMAQEARRDAIQ
jgi:hypothetical protein